MTNQEGQNSVMTRKSQGHDLPLNFHPAAIRVLANVTPSGAVSISVSRRCFVAERGVRPRGVVVCNPGIDELASLVEIDEQALVEKLVAHPAVEGFDVAILHRSARCDVMPFQPMLLRPA